VARHGGIVMNDPLPPRQAPPSLGAQGASAAAWLIMTIFAVPAMIAAAVIVLALWHGIAG
jgi:hypothetical protein